MGFTLITGGSGFLGSCLTRKLVEIGRKVVVLDINLTHSSFPDEAEQFKYIRCDLKDVESLNRVFSSYSISEVYHIAAIVGPKAEENLLETFDNNVIGTLNLLESARIFGIEKFFLGSSTGVYGNGIPSGELVGEDATQQPWHMYGSTKVCCEQLGERYHDKYGLDFRGLRYPPIFGLERRSKGLTGFCDAVIRESLEGRAYSIDAKPDTPVARALTVLDAADAAIALMESDESRLSRRMYNVGAISFTAGELAETVKRYIPHAEITFSNNKIKADQLKLWPSVDNRSAQRDWGWEAKHQSIDDYVKSMIDEYKQKKEKEMRND